MWPTADEINLGLGIKIKMLYFFGFQATKNGIHLKENEYRVDKHFSM